MNAIQKNYLAREVESASPAKLVLMLYDGALSAIRKAEIEIAAKRVPEAHHQLIKAQDIILSLGQRTEHGSGGIHRPKPLPSSTILFTTLWFGPISTRTLNPFRKSKKY
jgi:hypothetical protein